MNHIKEIIFYIAILFFIFASGANTGGNLYTRDKFIIKRKKHTGATLKNIVIDIIWMILYLLAGVICIILKPDERVELIVITILSQIAFITAIIKDIKNYKEIKKR